MQEFGTLSAAGSQFELAAADLTALHEISPAQRCFKLQILPLGEL